MISFFEHEMNRIHCFVRKTEKIKYKLSDFQRSYEIARLQNCEKLVNKPKKLKNPGFVIYGKKKKNIVRKNIQKMHPCIYW